MWIYYCKENAPVLKQQHNRGENIMGTAHSRRWGTWMSWLVVAIVLAACGSTASTTTADPSASSNTNDVSQTLVIYSGRSEALINPIITAFNEVHPDITVVLKSGKNNELAAAILEERNNPQADVFISTDMLSHINLSGEGALAAAPIAAAASVPDDLKAADGTWTSVTARARVIMYNTDMVSADEAPTSIFDLSDPKWKGKIAAANSTNGAMQAQVAGMYRLLGADATSEWLNGLVANNVTFFGGHTDVRKAVGAGEFAIGLVNHYYYELQKREANDNKVAVVYPDQADGQIGAFINTTAVGIVQGAPHRDNAQLFAEFLFEPETQRLFAELNYEYPLIAGVSTAADVLPRDQFRAVDIDMQAVASDVPQAVQLIQGAGIP